MVDGQEKVIVSHERKAENKLYILESGAIIEEKDAYFIARK